MAWAILLPPGLFETGWAIGLKRAEGFTRLWPTRWTILAMLVSALLPGVLLLAVAVGGLACSSGEPKGSQPPGRHGEWTRYVDPIIGTEGPGNVIPGPSRPHGMVKLSPDTRGRWNSVVGYDYRSDEIEGFSHTHLEGPGGSWNGYNNILLMPATGPIETETARYASRFSHDAETAEPGYYAVRLDDYGVLAELTSTERCGMHRYTFPRADDARVLIDVGHTRGESAGGRIDIVGDDRVEGFGDYWMHPLLALATLGEPGTTGRVRVYFSIVFDRPFRSFGTWQGSVPSDGSRRATGPGIGAFAGFRTAEGDVVHVKVGISFISLEQARESLAREIPHWDFDGVRRESVRIWDQALDRIRVKGGPEAYRVKFYTALYHSLLQPTNYMEYGRFWSGTDGAGRVYDDLGFRFHSDDWCLWDTFRTSHPLLVLLEPARASDIVRSYLHLYEQGGWLPKCTWQATGYSRIMIGNHSAALIVDACAKGLGGFDTALAYEAMRKSATQDNENLLSGLFCGYLNLGTPPDYLRLGFVPHECDPTQSVSMTLEHAYNDGCLAWMARELGKDEDFRYFAGRAENCRNHWNPAHGFMQPRTRNGDWLEPFDPMDETGFCEADSWKYTWFVPHDVAWLVERMGGPGDFVDRLDAYFHGGHHDMGNQPGFHVPYLYVYGGAPHKTQERVRALMTGEFRALPYGLPGNDDSGSMSAWFVWGAMGLFPICPGHPIYIIGSPLFEEIEIRPEPDDPAGLRFVIRAPGNAPDRPYVQRALLNGNPLDRSWIRHDEITAGGELVLEMGAAPSGWATRPENLPPSLLADGRPRGMKPGGCIEGRR